MWVSVRTPGKMTLADKWHCDGCDTTISSIDSNNPAHVARISGIDDDCHVQMVRNVMEK